MTSRHRHYCSARGCDRLVPFGVHLCGPHWARLPRELRMRIAATWETGDLDGWETARREANGLLGGVNHHHGAAR